MRDWNALVTVNAGGWNTALRLLRPLGRVQETGFLNVLLLHVDDLHGFLDVLRDFAARDPRTLACLGRVAVVETTFTFSTPEEFEARARAATVAYAPALTGKSFHVRVHRRGFKGRFSGHEEERAVADSLLQSIRAISDSGAIARISFEDPDFILGIETVGSQAGIALISREQLARYPFLRPG